MSMKRTSDANPFDAARFIGGVFGFAFAGIGITVLGFLWLTPGDSFGSPPLIFRIFGSFIAICFVAVGGTTLVGSVTGKLHRPTELMEMAKGLEEVVGESTTAPTASLLNYSCSKCGAQLGVQSEVSPLGDVKCSFCHQWFNIHKPSRPV